MSAQFGIWHLEGHPVSAHHFEVAETLLAEVAPDGRNSYFSGGLGILYRSFHTTKESRPEVQPHCCESGAILTWDGRLDNRLELVRQIEGGVSIESPDVAIVAAAFERWGTDAFQKLIGDWALSVAVPRERRLVLAKDPIGTRHLYYWLNRHTIFWSSMLDPLVLLRNGDFNLCEEYIAGWLTSFPATHLTPYLGLHSVPPAGLVVIQNGRCRVTKYWQFDPHKRIRYSNDSEYEEHFRRCFAQSVKRRLRSETPILAELSGGMDSSSIVCMADRVHAQEDDGPRLDTVSYFNDFEPNWNERPYFTAVEEQRGKSGCHIEVGPQRGRLAGEPADRFAAAPGSQARTTASSKEFAANMVSSGSRVVLSGIGGDEVLGGVPTPLPELADLVAQAEWHNAAKQAFAWALASRRPLTYIVGETLRAFVSLPLISMRKQPPSWLDQNFVTRHRTALTGYASAFKIFGPLPSFQENIATIEILRRQLSCCVPPTRPHYERRYPFLDRDLLEFLFAIPREQIIRPGQRRSLMRRALIGIVPPAILERKRKAFASRSPIAIVREEWERLSLKPSAMLTASLGIIDQHAFAKVLCRIEAGTERDVVPVLRLLSIEFWLGTVLLRRPGQPFGTGAFPIIHSQRDSGVQLAN